MKRFIILLNFVGGIFFTIWGFSLDGGDKVPTVIVGLIVTVGMVFGYFYLISQEKNEERLERIQTRYYDALQGSDKSEALRLGRIYYGSLRDDGNVTIYDEQAINNDLNSMKVATKVLQPQLNASSLEKLERLAQLKAQGVLTEDEFKVEKAKILSEK